MFDKRHLNDALAQPLSLVTSKPAWRGSDSANFAVFTEPPDAPGIAPLLKSLLGNVREAAEQDDLSERYSSLVGDGLDRSRGTRVEREVWKDGTHSQRIQYRLIATTAELAPIGYCTFAILTDQVSGFELEPEEVWAAPEWRGHGIGSAFAQIVASIAVHTIGELDVRPADKVRFVLPFPVLVTGDVYSLSGQAFLFSVGAALSDTSHGVRWKAFSKIGRIEVEPRW
ncbi:GNAT family N-acetyltransferase [Cupriavidus pampae]|uniref:GNAT family N-acetyltransferase n=1 Tax=Cupriavidus pampae TaxID=659251 RepID=UPI001CC6C5EE|nr:GNAT family N-acetyltransferase [Cupriavidus pampae]